MTDDEKTDETPQEEPREEGSDANPAGPDAAGDPPPPAVAEASSGEDAPAAPSAEEASEETAEGPTAEQDTSEGSGAEEDSAAEGSGEEEQAADAPEAEKRKGKPAKKDEKKKDLIPGADLEPIAVEPEERPLSAEERARVEAEEEERARKEAALVDEGAEQGPSASSRAPAEMDSGARYLATGKRKRSVARVTVLPGSGKIEVNKRPLEEFFPRPLHQTIARQPLATTGYETNVDVRVRVHGGGVSGQAGAVRHGIARALIEIDPALRGELKRRGFLTRDARVKERRKAGLKKARKRPQFSKR
jgi:small subunit ribosomal protein S9